MPTRTSTPSDSVTPHPDGTLMILQHDHSDRRTLVATELSGAVSAATDEPFYGVHFIQFPKKGQLIGGSAWSYRHSALRPPTAPDEILWVQQYLTAKRVIDLKAELVEAERDADAVARYEKLMA